MNKKNMDIYVYNITMNNEIDKINNFIKKYDPFIIKTVSTEKKEYISLENDEEYIIGVMAFNEAMEKYKIEKGNFFAFAKLVIVSRLRNYWKKENRYKTESLNDFQEFTENIEYKEDVNFELKEEIEEYEKELQKFGINFESLINKAPKHKDTRKNMIFISKEVSKEEDLTNHLYLKMKLPISKIVNRFNVTLRVIKSNKIFILSVVIIYFKKYKLIINWLKE